MTRLQRESRYYHCKEKGCKVHHLEIPTLKKTTRKGKKHIELGTTRNIYCEKHKIVCGKSGWQVGYYREPSNGKFHLDKNYK